MGLGAIDYAIHSDRKPSLLVVTDIDTPRLARAASIITVEEAAKNGVKLVYVNTNEYEDARAYLMELSGGRGYDDAFVYAPVKPVIELADSVLGFDGCLNFFAGPTRKDFAAMFNFYNVHYNFTHICGNSGGNTADMVEGIEMMNAGKLNPAAMITGAVRAGRMPDLRSMPPALRRSRTLMTICPMRAKRNVGPTVPSLPVVVP